MEVTVSFSIDIDKANFPKLKRLEHHIEELLDLASWPEIQTVYGVKVEKRKADNSLKS